MSPETVHPDTTLCKVGERGDRMWVLTSGSVNLLDGDGDVSTSLTATDLVTPAFGELCLFEDSPDRQFTVVATTQAEVRVLTGVQLRECFADHPGAESAMRMSVMSKYNSIRIAKLAASMGSVPIFKDCDPAFVESCSKLVRQMSSKPISALDLIHYNPLSSQMSPETVQSNGTLCKFGEHGDRMWVLTAGSVNLLDGDGDISTSLTATELVTPAFGELCLFEDSPDRQFTVVATTQAEVRVLTGVQLRECFADHPGAESAMRMSVMSKYNNIAESRLQQRLVDAQARVDKASAEELPEAEEALQKLKKRQAARAARASRPHLAGEETEEFLPSAKTKTEQFLLEHDANALQGAALSQFSTMAGTSAYTGAGTSAPDSESGELVVPARQYGFFNRMGPINLVQNDTKPWIPTGEGPGAWFVIDMGSSQYVAGFNLMNTDVDGRSTATFDILASDVMKGDYKTIVSNATLRADTDLVQFQRCLTPAAGGFVCFRYFKFNVKKARGEVGPGLRYISPVRCAAAAKTIQTAERGRRARSQVSELREVRRAQLREMEQNTAAAETIQSAERGRRARSQVSELREARRKAAVLAADAISSRRALEAEALDMGVVDPHVLQDWQLELRLQQLQHRKLQKDGKERRDKQSFWQFWRLPTAKEATLEKKLATLKAQMNERPPILLSTPHRPSIPKLPTAIRQPIPPVHKSPYGQSSKEDKRSPRCVAKSGKLSPPRDANGRVAGVGGAQTERAPRRFRGGQETKPVFASRGTVQDFQAVTNRFHGQELERIFKVVDNKPLRKEKFDAPRPKVTAKAAWASPSRSSRATAVTTAVPRINRRHPVGGDFNF